MNDKFTLYKMLYDKVEKLSKYRDIYMCKYTEDRKEIHKLFVDDGMDYYDEYKIKNYHTGKQIIAFLLTNKETEENVFIVHDKRTFKPIIEVRSNNVNIYQSSKMVIDSSLVQFTLFYINKKNKSHESMVLIFNNNTGHLNYIITGIDSIINNRCRYGNRLVEYEIHDNYSIYLTHKGIISSENVNISSEFLPETVKYNKLALNIELKE